MMQTIFPFFIAITALTAGAENSISTELRLSREIAARHDRERKSDFDQGGGAGHDSGATTPAEGSSQQSSAEAQKPSKTAKPTESTVTISIYQAGDQAGRSEKEMKELADRLRDGIEHGSFEVLKTEAERRAAEADMKRQTK